MNEPFIDIFVRAVDPDPAFQMNPDPDPGF
jgi:hypothetical protein